jgi:hypothetical protein
MQRRSMIRRTWSGLRPSRLKLAGISSGHSRKLDLKARRRKKNSREKFRRSVAQSVTLRHQFRLVFFNSLVYNGFMSPSTPFLGGESAAFVPKADIVM